MPLAVRQVMRAVAHIAETESGQNVMNVAAPTIVVNVGNRGAVAVRKDKRGTQSTEAATERNTRRLEFKRERALYVHNAKVKKDQERDVAEKMVKDKSKTNNSHVLRLKTELTETIATQTKLFVSANAALLTKIEDQNMKDKRIAVALLLSQVEIANRDFSAFEDVFQNDLLRTVNDVGNLPIHMLLKNANCAKIATIAEMKTLLPLADAGSPHLNRQDVRLCRNEAGATALDLVVMHRTNNFAMMCLLVHGADESLLCPRHPHSPLHAYLIATDETNVRKNAIRLLRGEDHKVLLLRNTSISDELPFHTALRMRYDISIISMLLPPLYSDRSTFSGASDEQVDALHTRARLSALHQYESSNPHAGGLLTRGSFVSRRV